MVVRQGIEPISVVFGWLNLFHKYVTLLFSMHSLFPLKIVKGGLFFCSIMTASMLPHSSGDLGSFFTSCWLGGPIPVTTWASSRHPGFLPDPKDVVVG